MLTDVVHWDIETLKKHLLEVVPQLREAGVFRVVDAVDEC
jgi:hypothetical protein